MQRIKRFQSFDSKASYFIPKIHRSLFYKKKKPKKTHNIGNLLRYHERKYLFQTT